MPLTTDSQEVPVKIVGSSVFGRYPTISPERTYNMFITTSGDGQEEWLVNFPGFKHILNLVEGGAEGRGIFRSVRGGFMLAVVSADVFRIDLVNEVPTLIGILAGSTGEVFFDENLSNQISIVGNNANKIYNYVLAPAAISDAVYVGLPANTFVPNYVTYQNTYLIYGNALSDSFGSLWHIFESGSDGVTLATAYTLKWRQSLALQTKPDFARAVLRIPGKGNNIIVFGTTVAEIWTNVGGQLVYQRNSSLNIDFGAASVATIAANDDMVAWLGVNEKSSNSLMVMQGGRAERISTDGFDDLLEGVKFPAQSTAVLYRQGGHVFYILSFINPADNFSIVYDFTTKKFYDSTDWDFSVFPARQIVFYKNETYFISFKDGGVYAFNSDLTQYEVYNPVGANNIYDIPRVRVTNTYRISNRPEKYKVKMFTFIIESGTNGTIFNQAGFPRPRVDLTISKNGGNTFSNVVSYDLKAAANYQNQPRFNNLGYCQQIGYQLRFWNTGRTVVKNGTMEISE
jgi:hypothetical protein